MKKLSAISLFTLASFFAEAQVNSADSISIKKISEGFYSWYAAICHDHISTSFNPNFVEGKEGMTTLDFSKYRKGLAEHHFSKSLIEEKINNFKPCLDNLKKIPYKLFKDFTDLDQFEDIRCDFNNTYEFTGGMEPSDGADLIAIIPNGKTKATVILQMYYVNSGTKHNFGKARMMLRKGRKWKINSLDLIQQISY